MTQGRAFAEADSQTDDHRIVLSDGLWRRRFGARPDVINSTITLDGHAVTIVGVASPDLTLPSTAEFWQPLIFAPRDLSPESRGAQWVGAGAAEDRRVATRSDDRVADDRPQPRA
jgi:putative ABC transport system permease protein